ncbi:hypothetical protein AAMO2058_000993800 [Amorphochlora amoebiformis]
MADKSPPWFLELTDLACANMGSRVVFATDEWFAGADNLLSGKEAIFIDDKFTPQGKWMDGWESRRKRTAGHDWSIIQLGYPGSIRGVVIDTRFFTGNQAPRFSLQGAEIDPENKTVKSLLDLRPSKGIGTKAEASDVKLVEELKSSTWTELIPMTALKPGYHGQSVHYFEIRSKFAKQRFTHLRLNMYPDGGIARMRLYGTVKLANFTKGQAMDLAAAENGGVAVTCSDAHYGKPANLIALGRAPTMADGWETARKPNRPAILKPDSSGMIQFNDNDWAILRLCTAGNIKKILIDTNHFKGNFPESCIIEGCYCSGNMDYKEEAVLFKTSDSKVKWFEILPRTKLTAHEEVSFKLDKPSPPVTHVRLTIFPDGGVSRLRLFGTPIDL